mgnify:CR=1 FL=1
MIYSDYLSYKKDLEKIIELLKEQKSQVETEIGAYTFKREKSLLDFQNYLKLLTINSYYSREIQDLMEKARISESQYYKDLYIAKNGKESLKDWQGIVLWFLQKIKIKLCVPRKYTHWVNFEFSILDNYII